jgi:hypothetical protein
VALIPYSTWGVVFTACVVFSIFPLRAELAAIGAAIRHGYCHIATDSLTSMHQIKKLLLHRNLHCHHIQGDILQPFAKAIHQSSSPMYKYKSKSHAVIIGNGHTMLLLESQSQPTLPLLIPPSKQLALREIPSVVSTGLQKNTKITKPYKHSIT